MRNTTFNILLADDDEADRLIFTDAFSELKIKTLITTVNSGAQLMEWLYMEEVILPHIIFLDLNMPGKNGLQCLKEIRSNEKIKDVFVAIYSTSNSEKDMEDTFNNGANVYITKPSDFNALKQVLERVVMTISLYKDTVMKRENFLLRL